MYTTTINLTEYLQFSFDYYFSLIYATNQLFQSSVQFNNWGIYSFITDIKILYFLLHALPPYLELLVFITMGFAVKTTQVEVFIWISSRRSLWFQTMLSDLNSPFNSYTYICLCIKPEFTDLKSLVGELMFNHISCKQLCIKLLEVLLWLKQTHFSHIFSMICIVS